MPMVVAVVLVAGCGSGDERSAGPASRSSAQPNAVRADDTRPPGSGTVPGSVPGSRPPGTGRVGGAAQTLLVSVTYQITHTAKEAETFSNEGYLLQCDPGNADCGKDPSASLWSGTDSVALPDNLGPYVTSIVDVDELYVGTSTNQILSCGTQSSPAKCQTVDSFGAGVSSLTAIGDLLYAGLTNGDLESCPIGGANNCTKVDSLGDGVSALTSDGSAYVYAGTTGGALLQCAVSGSNNCSTLATGLGSVNSVAVAGGYVFTATQNGHLYSYDLATSTNATLVNSNPESQFKQLLTVGGNVYSASNSGYLSEWTPGSAQSTQLTGPTTECDNFTAMATDGQGNFYLMAGLTNNVCLFPLGGTLSVVTSFASCSAVSPCTTMSEAIAVL